MTLTEVSDQASWDQFVNGSDFGHPLQLWGWGEAKRPNGWTPHRLMSEDGTVGAQVLLWRVPRTQWLVAYVPRGPVAEAGSEVAQQLMMAVADWVKRRGAIYLRIEPAWRGSKLGWPGWRRSKDNIQMAQTYLIDLTKPEEELLAAIDAKYRYYIRKVERDGVTVRRLAAGDLGDVFAIYQETAQRAGFGLHTRDYYEHLSKTLGEYSYLLVAEKGGQQVAFLWLAAAGRTAYELYGGVNQAGRDVRANYLLKWEAIKLMQQSGYQVYDFNGRVSEGVSTFKANFAPQEVDWVGTWDLPLRPAAYAIWQGLWPLAKPVGRALRRAVKR